MKKVIIDGILNTLRERLESIIDAKSGAPERVTFIFQYPYSTVSNGFDISYSIEKKADEYCGDKEELNES